MRNTLLSLAIVLAIIIDAHLLYNAANARTATTNYTRMPYNSSSYSSPMKPYLIRIGESYSAKRVQKNHQSRYYYYNSGCTWYRASRSPIYSGRYQRCQPIRNTIRFFRCRQPVRTFFRNGGFFRRGCW